MQYASCHQDYFFMQLQYSLSYLTTNINTKGSVPLMFKNLCTKHVTFTVSLRVREAQAPAPSPALILYFPLL